MDNAKPREPRSNHYSPSNNLLRSLVDEPGLILPVLPRQHEILARTETTGYVLLKVEGPYFDKKEGRQKQIPSSDLAALKEIGVCPPSHVVFDHLTRVYFSASPHEVVPPLVAAEWLRTRHGSSALIDLLEADCMDLLCLDPSAPHNDGKDAQGRVYHRELIHRVGLYDLIRADNIPPHPEHGHSMLQTKSAEGEQIRGVGRLWRDNKTTHLIIWRMPDSNYKPGRPSSVFSEEWKYPGLSTFGRKGRGLIIMLDIGLFDLIRLRYFQACAYLMPAFDAHFGTP